MKPTHKRSVSTQGQPTSAPIVAITRLLAMSCARYRKLRAMEAPEFVLDVERMLIERYMSRLTKAHCACVN
jgi:hypothetical protein